MKRTASPTTAAGRNYPAKPCQFCGEEVPKYSEKTGMQLWRSKYLQKKSCHNETCKELAHSSNRPQAAITVPDDMMNRFILGR